MLTAAGAVAAMLLTDTPAAAQARYEGLSANMVRRLDPAFDDDQYDSFELRPVALETGFETNNRLRYVLPVENGGVWRFEGQARYRGYFDRGDLNSLLLVPSVQYWQRFADNRWQYRLAGSVRYFERDGQSRYVSFETEAQLRRRATDYHETVLRAVLAHRDFNEDVLRGFDQDRLRLGLEHYWKPTGGTSYIRGRYFYDTVDAELDRASYERHIAELSFLWDPDTEWAWRGALEYREQDNKGPLSATFPFALEEQRSSISLGPEYAFSGNAVGHLELGAVENDSNLAPRDFSGATFNVGLELSF